MKHVCTHCLKIASEGTRWCQNRDMNCPPGTLSLVLDEGEIFDDLKILGLIRIFQTAALYQARRGNDVVFLKIAHSGNEERLKAEARTLSTISQQQIHPALPTLVSASSVDHRAYNRFSLYGEMKYYTVYQAIDGKFLRELLKAQSQIPPVQAARLLLGLSDLIAFLHLKHEKLVLNLNPSNVFVRTDRNGIWRPVLFDLAWLSTRGEAKSEWFARASEPAYLAPEQIRGEPASMRTDVYLLGVLLYEMLAGQPPFPFELHKYEEIRSMVLASEPVRLDKRRRELAQGLVDIVHQAMEKAPNARQPDVRTFAKGLRTLFGEVPAEPKGIQIDRRLIAVAVLISVFLLLTLIVWLLTGQ